MTTNNWHVPLSNFSDEQRAIIERVYGGLPLYRFLISFEKGVMTTIQPYGEEITANEAFAILGLDRPLDTDLVTVKNLKVQNKALHQELAELEQQLANQPEQGLQDVDWSLVEHEYNWLAQRKSDGDVDFFEVYPKQDFYTILATRPKPKVKALTPEQIEAVREFWDWFSGVYDDRNVDEWLKEREQ